MANGFYNKLFAVFYRFLKDIGNDDFEFYSVVYVAVIQLMHFTVILLILSKSTGISLYAYFPSKYYLLILIVPWLFFIYRYYSKQRIEQILLRFDKIKNKEAWGFIAIASLLLPFCIFIFLTIK